MGIDPNILAMIDELDGLRNQRDDHWQVPRIEGQLLYQFALVVRARLIVEVGTSYGFSGLFWAAALQSTSGKLHTIDLSQKKYDSSRQTFAKAKVQDVIVSHHGNALEVLPTIPDMIDIAFLDADKDMTQKYFDLVWPKVRPGGSVLTDNATTHRKELSDFVAHVRSRKDATSSEIPVGNGLEWTVKLPR